MPFRTASYKRVQVMVCSGMVLCTAWIVLNIGAAAFEGWKDCLAMILINGGMFALSRYSIAPAAYSRDKPYRYLIALWIGVLGMAFYLLLHLSVWLGGGTWKEQGDWEIANGYEVLFLLAVPMFLGWMVYLIDRAKISWDQLLELEAEVIRSHFFPHFLKNTLSVLRVLAKKKPKRAAEMADPLIAIFRYYNSIRGERTHLLSAEMEQVKNLCKIYRLKRNRKLCVCIECDQPAVYAIKIPVMVLMTLMENCCLYGVVNDPERPVRLKFVLLPDGMLYMSLTNVRKNGNSGHEVGTQLGLPLIISLLKTFGKHNRIDVTVDNHLFTVEMRWKDKE